MKISAELHAKKRQLVAGMALERQPWWQYWRTLSDYYLPSRYVALQTDKERRLTRRNDLILDSTGTKAADILSGGMMNGITSPARPWFKLRVKDVDNEDNPAVSGWTDEVERRMLRVMAESNFYQCMGVLFTDLNVFATACALIYESPENVIACFNPPLGEYYLGQNAERRVNSVARDFTMQVGQVVDEFGIGEVTDTVKNAYNLNNDQRTKDVPLVHLIEPNDDGLFGVSRSFAYRELVWEKNAPDGFILRARGFHDFLAIAPRWETTGNDTYGSNSPGMKALGDVIQLQHETKAKGQALDKMNKPPLLVDAALKNQPFANLPNGLTYVARLDATNGARPIYTVNPPLGEMSADIRDIQIRIRETFHNDLFQMISQLDTVRSAAEIDARREEKLVLLGPVLERFENEALDPAIERIYGIMQRKGLLPPAPEAIRAKPLEIQYVSILSSAQSAVGTAPTERFLQLIGNLVQIWPEVKEIPNVPELARDYARDIGVKAKNLTPRQEADARVDAMNQQAQQQQMLEQAGQAAQGAQLLSQTEVGGGQNALMRLLGSQ